MKWGGDCRKNFFKIGSLKWVEKCKKFIFKMGSLKWLLVFCCVSLAISQTIFVKARDRRQDKKVSSCINLDDKVEEVKRSVLEEEIHHLRREIEELKIMVKELKPVSCKTECLCVPEMVPDNHNRGQKCVCNKHVFSCC